MQPGHFQKQPHLRPGFLLVFPDPEGVCLCRLIPVDMPDRISLPVFPDLTDLIASLRRQRGNFQSFSALIAPSVGKPEIQRIFPGKNQRLPGQIHFFLFAKQ